MDEMLVDTPVSAPDFRSNRLTPQPARCTFWSVSTEHLPHAGQLPESAQPLRSTPVGPSSGRGAGHRSFYARLGGGFGVDGFEGVNGTGRVVALEKFEQGGDCELRIRSKMLKCDECVDSGGDV